MASGTLARRIVIWLGMLPAGAGAALLAPGCRPGGRVGPTPTPAPQAEPEMTGPRLQPPWELAQRLRQAHVYVDLSASMQSYVRKPDSVLQRFAAEVKGALFVQGVDALQGAGFGAQMQQLRDLAGLSDALAWPARDVHSCLADPFRQEAAAGDKTVLTLVLTDGVASAVGQSCGSNCASGSDVGCVAEAAYRYISSGRALWVVGFRTAYTGTYYSEMKDSSALAVSKPVERPIYLWIGGADVAAGRAIVTQLRDWLVAHVGAENSLAFEVWPGTWSGLRTACDAAHPCGAGDFQPGAALSLLRCGGPNDESTPALQGIEAQTPWPRVKLRPRRQDIPVVGAVWPMRLPLAAADTAQAAPGRLLTLSSQLEVTAGKPGEPGTASGLTASGAQVPQVVAGPQGRHVLACVRLTERRGRLITRWRAGVDTGLLAPWSTEDDSSLNNITRTLGLERMWSQVAQRLAREVDDGLETVLLEFVVQQ